MVLGETNSALNVKHYSKIYFLFQHRITVCRLWHFKDLIFWIGCVFNKYVYQCPGYDTSLADQISMMRASYFRAFISVIWCQLGWLRWQIWSPTKTTEKVVCQYDQKRPIWPPSTGRRNGKLFNAETILKCCIFHWRGYNECHPFCFDRHLTCITLSSFGSYWPILLLRLEIRLESKRVIIAIVRLVDKAWFSKSILAVLHSHVISIEAEMCSAVHTA